MSKYEPYKISPRHKSVRPPVTLEKGNMLLCVKNEFNAHGITIGKWYRLASDICESHVFVYIFNDTGGYKGYSIECFNSLIVIRTKTIENIIND